MSTRMYDSTQPGLIPATAEYIAIYANGRWPASRDAVKRQHPRARIFHIDVIGDDPGGCGIADVENGDLVAAGVPGWVDQRLALHPGVLCRVYCNQSTWPAVKAEVAKLEPDKRRQVRYWIARPTGSPHRVPGADATQFYWGEDWDESVLDVSTFAGVS